MGYAATREAAMAAFAKRWRRKPAASRGPPQPPAATGENHDPSLDS